MNFMIVLSASEEKVAWDIDRGYTESVDQFGKICYLNNTNFFQFMRYLPIYLSL